MTQPTPPARPTTRAARRAQLLFDRSCAAARRQSLGVGVRSPLSLPLPEHIRPEAGNRA